MTFAPKPIGCHKCPAYNYGLSFVPPEGPMDATYLFFGQGPGEDEAHQSRPFFADAQSGWRLTQWMYQAGLQRNEVLIGNLVQCWLPEGYSKGRPYKSRDPLLSEVQFCWNAHVGEWVHEWHAKMCTSQNSSHHILPVGVPAAKFILGLPWGKGAERYAGTSQLVELPPIGVNNAQ